jgi:hypothetical protein
VAVRQAGPETHSPQPTRVPFGRILRYWPLIVLAIELVVGWFVLRVDLWSYQYLLPAPILIMVGTSVVLVLCPWVFRTRRHAGTEDTTGTPDGRRRASSATFLLVVVLIVLTYLFGLPAKMSLISSSAQNVANQLLANPSVRSGLIECWKAPSNIVVVGLLISADEVCAQGQGDGFPARVWRQQDNRRGAGIAYFPSPVVADGWDAFQGSCLRCIYGPWSALGTVFDPWS